MLRSCACELAYTWLNVFSCQHQCPKLKLVVRPWFPGCFLQRAEGLDQCSPELGQPVELPHAYGTPAQLHDVRLATRAFASWLLQKHPPPAALAAISRFPAAPCGRNGPRGEGSTLGGPCTTRRDVGQQPGAEHSSAKVLGRSAVWLRCDLFCVSLALRWPLTQPHNLC